MNVIIVVTIVALTQARIYQSYYNFTEFGKTNGWIFLDKMTFAPGVGKISIETTVEGTPKGTASWIFMQVISQDGWQLQQDKKCKSPIRMPLSVHNISFDGSTTTSSVQLNIEDYKTYYFVLKDCQSRMINDYNNPDLVLYVKLHMLNNDREVGEEQDHWYFIPFILIAGILLIKYYHTQYKKNENHSEANLLLFVGIATQICSLFWKLCGFIIYNYTGADYHFFHFAYLLLHSSSESTVITLVVLIAFGWTLNYKSGHQLQIYLPMIVCLGLVNIFITILTKVGHSYDGHHLFDNLGGTILIVFRTIFILVFISGAIYSYLRSRQQIRAFIIKFGVIGIIYISSMPVIVLLANTMIQAKGRHQFVFITVEVTKFITNLILVYQFNAKNSLYHKINLNDSSFIPYNHSGF